MPDVGADLGAEESVARAALTELSPAGSVGEVLERTVQEDGVVQLSFAATLSGYPGWHWSVSLAELPGEQPTVLEAELMPGEGALLAPDWVPWAERLEEYRAAQAALAAEAAENGDVEADDDDADDDDAEDDEDLGDEMEADDDLYTDDLEPDDDLDDDDLDDGFDDDEPDADDDLAGVASSGVDEQSEPEDETADDGPEQPDEA